MRDPALKVAFATALVAVFALPLAATVKPGPDDSAPRARGEAVEGRAQAQQPTSAPALTGTGPAARQAAVAFRAWASASTLDQVEEVRRALAQARDNAAIVDAFCADAEAASASDTSQALVSLSLLGEMRSPRALPCLQGFLARPLPTQGTVVDGEIQERVALEMLQAKAVVGLAYLRSAEGDRQVLAAVRDHPSRLVRSEAAISYLWNHQFSDQARGEVKRFVRKGEEVFLDRPIRAAGQSPEEYDRQLDAYLTAHPELQPPPPAH